MTTLASNTIFDESSCDVIDAILANVSLVDYEKNKNIHFDEWKKIYSDHPHDAWHTRHINSVNY